MTDEIGRREFIKRGTVAGVVATTGLSAAAGREPHAARGPRSPAMPGAATVSAPSGARDAAPRQQGVLPLRVRRAASRAELFRD